MRLSFTADQQEIAAEFVRVLSAEASSERARKAVASSKGWDSALWQELAGLGWFGLGIDERFGGLGRDYLTLCLVAEAFGANLAAIPFASSALGFADAIATIEDEVIARSILPSVAAGKVIGAIVPAENWDRLDIQGGRARGVASAVPDGAALTHLITLGSHAGTQQVVLIEIEQCVRRKVDSLDRVNLACAIELDDAPVRILAERSDAQAIWSRMIDRHAIYLAFMQVGGASAALRAARDYVGQRYAFGRALGSFQGIKHGLADVYAAVEVARSNAWYAAACLDIGNYKLTLAAAAARVSATEAFRRAARANIHYQGGLGVTQEADAHLYYRRAQALGMTIGNPAVWRERFLQASLALRNAATPLDRAA